MSKQIIIDWQRDGLFVAMGTRRGNSVAIETLVTTGGEGATGSSTAISTQLFALAKKLDLNKAEATIIAPREVLEFRSLSVPRGDADEVPDMVRFQAQRQMANIGDTWPLDYVLLPDQPGAEGISALAATISPAHMAEIEATCSDLGIQLTRVLARPVEIARWGVMLGNLSDVEAALVISVSETHADLLTVSYGSLIQVRGTRLSSESTSMAGALVSEIRRSVMAASNHLNNQPVTKIVLIASPDIAEKAESQISEATGASVAVVDPASILPSQLAERHELAHRAASRIAAVAGVVSNPSPDQRNVIDLKNPKRRQPKKGRKRELMIAGGGAAALLLTSLYLWWSSHAELDQQIRTAQKTEAEKAEQVKTLSPQIKQRQDVDSFLAGSINWLDEMKFLAANAPSSSDVVLTNPSFDYLVDRNSGRGQITVTAEARKGDHLGQLRTALNDKDHEITGSGPKEMAIRRGEYGWDERETIRIAPRAWDPLAKPPTAKPPVAAAADSKQPAKPSGKAGDSAAVKPSDKSGDKSSNETTPAASPSDDAPKSKAESNGAPKSDSKSTDPKPTEPPLENVGSLP